MVADCLSDALPRSSVVASDDQPLELLSLHVPKALGTSLAEVLVGHYGRERIVGDYAISLEGSPPAMRFWRPVLKTSTAVIHGHFPAIRYAGMAARRRVTLLREPLQRLLSHFFFWQAQPRHGNPLHDRVLDEHLGLIDFAKLPAIRHFYSETIFGGCDMASFDLVGIVEELERDWPRFQRLTGIAAPLPHRNRNRYPGYTDLKARALADLRLMRELRRILAEDIAFYERFA
ncbi:MAG: sulfotransferase family protein [Alphaproteobacteria bacterium]|nr:sulfotransferase family protein [Alphaproteobacteria bacterium]